MLRDVIRNISNLGKNVGVVDERGEIANQIAGVSTLNLGPRTDVISYIDKVQGIKHLVRSMGLDVIATDEISSSQDMHAIAEAKRSGVKVIATSHGDVYGNIPCAVKKAIKEGAFDVIVYISGKIGNVEKISLLKEEVNVY